MLDSLGFNTTEIVAADEKFLQISTNILTDKELADAVSIIGWGCWHSIKVHNFIITKAWNNRYTIGCFLTNKLTVIW